MTNKNQALAEIQKIIERFQKLPEAERSKYNEAQIRHSFILPLFRALGWDIENPAEMTAEEFSLAGQVTQYLFLCWNYIRGNLNTDYPQGMTLHALRK